MPPIEELNQEKPITFAIYLDNKFPFVFPKIHILSHVFNDSISLLNQQWLMVEITLKT